MTKPTAHIEDWEVVNHRSGGRILHGRISGHINQDNFRAARQQTSKLVKLDEANGTAETLNTLYTLGAKSEQARQVDTLQIALPNGDEA